MSTHITTDDPKTVAACPECDAVRVRHRASAATPDEPYRCCNCTATFPMYVERVNKRHRDADGRLSMYINPEHPRLVAACPLCDSNDVHYRGSAATVDAPYRCDACSSMIPEYVTRTSENGRWEDVDDGLPLDPAFIGVPVPETVYESSRSSTVYHHPDCPQLVDNRTPYRREVVRAWPNHSGCKYCIGADDAPDADPSRGVVADD